MRLSNMILYFFYKNVVCNDNKLVTSLFQSSNSSCLRDEKKCPILSSLCVLVFWELPGAALLSFQK
jgi:hypothetical protein